MRCDCCEETARRRRVALGRSGGFTVMRCAPLLVREQTVLITALAELRKLLPFPLLGFDTDNDSVFMNESVQEYCLRDNIELTRCRPYRKNDQAFVEQKNGAVVRKIVGYRRELWLKLGDDGLRRAAYRGG